LAVSDFFFSNMYTTVEAVNCM